MAASAIAALAVPASAAAAPGDADSSFGNAGVVVVPIFAPCMGPCIPEFGGADADAVTIQPDGKVLVAGGVEGAPREAGRAQPRGAIVRLGDNGALDLSFGRGGIVEEPILRISQVDAMPDGTLLAYGRGEFPNPPSQRGFGVERYTDTGLPDESFGHEGLRWLGGTDEQLRATKDGEGRLLFLREALRGLELLRFLPSGQPDVSFGSGGTILMPLHLLVSGEPEIVAADNGRVVVAYLGLSHSPAQPERSRELFLARVTTGGQLDRSFGHAGIAATGMILAQYEHSYAAAMSPRGRIIVVAAREGRLDAAEFSSAGNKIRLFGNGGVARLGPTKGVASAPSHRRGLYRLFGLSPAAIAFDPAGDAIATGEWDGNTFLAGYTTKGRDCSFGARGLVATSLINVPNAIAVQPDGRILVVGTRRDHRLSFVAARFMGGGTSHTCSGEGVREPAPRRKPRPQRVVSLGPVSVRAPVSSNPHGPVTISFAPSSHLPRGGYYYAVAALSESSEPSCALSSDMHKTAYGFPRPKHRVMLTLYPAPSPSGHWCELGFYEGAVYAVPHRLRCTKEYPCYRGKAAQCSYEEAERSPCILGIVLKPVYAYPGGLPQPIDGSTKIVGRFQLRFAGGS